LKNRETAAKNRALSKRLEKGKLLQNSGIPKRGIGTFALEVQKKTNWYPVPVLHQLWGTRPLRDQLKKFKESRPEEPVLWISGSMQRQRGHGSTMQATAAAAASAPTYIYMRSNRFC